jgi:chromodomain-helicase-DNA-binding protein 1
MLTLSASTRTGNNSSIQPSSDEDGSDEDDVYGGAKGRSFAKKHRRQKQASASGAGTPQLGEVRFSTRQAAKVTNYNEEDDYGLSEEDTENVTPNHWVVEQTGPAVDTVLNHRLVDGAGMLCHLQLYISLLIDWMQMKRTLPRKTMSTT